MKQSESTAICVPVIVLLDLVFCTHTNTTFGAESAHDKGLLAWWKFDRSESKTVVDSVTGIKDEVLGFFKYVKGISGDALRFDGYSTVVQRKAKDAPKLGKSFSIEAWVAPQAYPWGMCAIVGQCQTQDVPFARRTHSTSFPGAVTIVNMEGATYTHSWADGPGELEKRAQLSLLTELSYPNIQIVNTKSKAKPFLIVSDKAFECGWPIHDKVDGPVHHPYTMMVFPENSMFTWWNHWPVAQIPSDGRFAYDPDRVSHTAVTNWLWAQYESNPDSQVKIAMHGLTEKHPTELATLARSWLRAPKLFNRSRGFTNKGYDQAQRAYIFECHDTDQKRMRFELPASEDQPLVNPAFVIKNWGNDDIKLEVNRQPVERGKALRYAHVRTPTGADLVIWIQLEETKHTEIRISQKEK